MTYSLFIGRYQPLHAGHIKLIRKVLDEGKNVCIALRDTGIDEKNPYSLNKRMWMFSKEFGKEILLDKMKLIVIPDISEICYGRKVGWGIREIKLDEDTEKISATEIRSTISKDLGFSQEDRLANNLRIAGLANLLNNQGFEVVVSTICPTDEIKEKVYWICKCRFIEISGRHIC